MQHSDEQKRLLVACRDALSGIGITIQLTLVQKDGYDVF
jgi:hypothetical protein